MIDKLPPRERQVFDALCACGEATAVEIRERMADPPSNSAVRIMLSRLEKKGFVTRRVTDQAHVYATALPQTKIRQSALAQIIQTFFNGSPIGAATALVGMSETIDPEELARLEEVIAKTKQEQTK